LEKVIISALNTLNLHLRKIFVGLLLTEVQSLAQIKKILAIGNIVPAPLTLLGTRPLEHTSQSVILSGLFLLFVVFQMEL
jgi:hypothetical protein